MNPREEDSDSGASTCQLPSLAAPTLEELNALIPAYEFLEFVDQGGMGMVYKARQKCLNRIVAIKTLPPTNQNRRTFAERFKREAEALASLNHPNIVSIYDSGVAANGIPYYVMEFVKGSNLRGLMKTGTMSSQQMLAIATQVCGALQYAHGHDVVHRDIKPGNILLDEEGNAKVADFGLAKVLGLQQAADGLTSPLDALGTPEYTAPEVLKEGGEVDHRADIYSLGVMLYEMSTGHVPKGNWQPPSRCGADFMLDELVSRALQPDPDLRYQSVSDLTQDLRGMQKVGGLPAPEKAAAKYPVTAPPAAAPRREGKSTSHGGNSDPSAPRRLVRWILLLLMLLLSLGAVGVALWQSPDIQERVGINKKPAVTSSLSQALFSQETPPKTPEAMMHDQLALAKWVFDRGGLINVATAQQKEPQLGDQDALRFFVSLPKENFTILRVSFNDEESFTDKDLAQLLQLAGKAQSVTNLTLRGAKVTPKGLESLSLLKSTLVYLNLRNTTAFSAQSVPFITSCDRLKMLFVSNAAADRVLVKKLKSALPDCEIFTEKSDVAD